MSVIFYFESPKKSKTGYPRADTDNLLKAVQDACNGIFYRDDSQLVEIRARKEFAEASGISVRIMSFESYRNILAAISAKETA